jgi:phospholipase C
MWRSVSTTTLPTSRSVPPRPRRNERPRNGRRIHRLSRALRLLTCAFAASLALSACGGASGGSASLPQGTPLNNGNGASKMPIKHIVLMIQENRTFNDLFATFPGAIGTTTGEELVKQSSGGYTEEPIKLAETNLEDEQNLSHVYSAYLTAEQSGKMDGFDLIKYESNGKYEGSTPYQYVNPNQVKPYWDIASHWGLADEMFQTQGSGSFIAHQDLIRGGTFITSTESLIDDPTAYAAWGCESPEGAKTSLITTQLKYLRDEGPFPCTSDFPDGSTEYKTLADLFSAKSPAISWKYYTPASTKETVGAWWNAFLVIASICNSQGVCDSNISIPQTNIFNDISSGTLPQMSWVVPDAQDSDHPGYSAKDMGPSWVASVVNAIGQSSYWDSTAIIVVWDDWGGFYDPVAPPFQDDQGGPGFRVAMLVISPYVKAGTGSEGGYISNTVYGFGSIIKFIEDTWDLGRLGTTDVTSKSIANMFDFKQSPRKFQSISSTYDRAFFLRQKPSGLPVDTE